MAETNPLLVNLLYRSAISSLSSNKREIYQFIESKELELEELAISEKHFVQLMVENSPFKEAADHFSMDISSVKKIMDSAQTDIDTIMVKRLEKVRWIDYTNEGKVSSRNPKKNWTFVFVS